MKGESYQNWLYHTLYYLQRRKAPKGKIIGMVTKEEFITYIQKLEKKGWEQATTLEKEYGEIDPPKTKVQINNSLRGLKGRKLIREYKNKEGTKCIRTL